MCAGIMTVFAPPSLAGLCYLVWDKGYSLAVQRRAVQQSTATYLAGLTTLLGAYRAQSLLVFPHFDTLGTSTWKKTADVLGEPLKVCCPKSNIDTRRQPAQITRHGAPNSTATQRHSSSTAAQRYSSTAAQRPGRLAQVSTWSQFYKLAGPPVLARCAGVVVSFYLAGCAQGFFAQRLSPLSAAPAPTAASAAAAAGARAAAAPKPTGRAQCGDRRGRAVRYAARSRRRRCRAGGQASSDWCGSER